MLPHAYLLVYRNTKLLFNLPMGLVEPQVPVLEVPQIFPDVRISRSRCDSSPVAGSDLVRQKKILGELWEQRFIRPWALL